MNYKQKYEQALERAKVINPGTADYEVAVKIFPELKESEEERIRKSIIGFLKTIASLKDGKTVSNEDFDSIVLLEWADWLEKQGEPIDEEKVLIDARKGIAISIMNFLNRNTLGMCLSNMECKDLEDAVVDSDWSKVYNYMKKKLEKQSEQKSAWSEDERQIIEKAASFILACINIADTKEEEERLEKLADKLQDLRPQLKQEWSEEDEEMLEGLNNCLTELEEKNGWRYVYVNNKDVEIDKIRNRLKSIKERMKGE